MNRIGIRVQDIFDEKILRQKVEGVLELKNQLLAKIYNRRATTVDETVEELLQYADRLAPMVADTGLLLNQALDRGETVLLEAGQATLLDVDHGTYPFVTSSSATAGGACTGSGIPPMRIDRVIGIVKAYTTRVGEGPFPTELFDDATAASSAQGRRRVRHHDRPRPSVRLVRRGHRPLRRARQRRHRLRAHQARRAHRSGEDPGVRRLRRRRRPPRRDAGEPDRLPPRRSRSTSTSTAGGRTSPAARTFADLPPNAQAYVQALEEMSGARISAVGVGPGATQTVVVHDLI